MKVGIRVRLKSGGPVMTVEEVVPGGDLVTCIWFDKRGRCERKSFNKEVLDEVRGGPAVRVIHLGRPSFDR